VSPRIVEAGVVVDVLKDHRRKAPFMRHYRAGMSIISG
jgi:hypothetical protein